MILENFPKGNQRLQGKRIRKFSQRAEPGTTQSAHQKLILFPEQEIVSITIQRISLLSVILVFVIFLFSDVNF